MSKPDYSDELAQLDSCAGLNLAQLRTIGSCVYPVSYRPGDFVVKKGEDSKKLFLTRDGLWKIYLPKPRKIPSTLNIDGKFTTLAEYNYILGGGHTANILALTGGRVFVLEHADVSKLAIEIPAFKRNLLCLMRQRVSASDFRDTIQKTCSQTAYLAFWLVLISDKCNETRADGKPIIPYDIGNGEYAALIGTDQSQVSKVFTRLKVHGLIEQNGCGHIVILDRWGLENYDKNYRSS